MNITSTITIIEQTTRRYGLDLPKAYTAGITKIRETYADDYQRTSALDAIRSAITNKRDPYTDPRVHTAITLQHHGHEIASVISQARDNALAQHVADHTESILDSWHEQVADLGEAISEAAEKLPSARFDKAADINTAGTQPHYLELWGAAHEATKKLTGIEQIITMLVGTNDRRYRALLGAELTIGQHEELTRNGDAGQLWAAATLGLRLDLIASRTDYHARRDALDDSSRQRTATQQDMARREPIPYKIQYVGR